MSRADKIAFLVPLVVLSIAAVFIYLTVIDLDALGSASIVLAWILGFLIVVFFAVLVFFGLVLAVIALADRIHYYVVLREERDLRRRQVAFRRNRITEGTYSYQPRRLQNRYQPLDDMTNNGS